VIISELNVQVPATLQHAKVARHNFFVGDLYYWIDFNMSKHMGKYTGVEWKNIWSHACHQIWYWRNRERHEKTFSRPSNMAMEVLRHVIAIKKPHVV
jgi:hypothetical protein